MDLESGRFSYVRTRWPPEPNGYLHIGHAKAICTDFGIAADFGGACNFRFDDTNPAKEEQEYVDAIKADTRWLGFEWGDREFFASDYFEQLYRWAEQLITAGKAYVCDLSEKEIREYRGTDVADKGPITVTPPGRNSPYRDRSVEENLDLFAVCAPGSSPTARAPCGRKSTWHIPISICVTLSCIASVMRRTIARAMHGAFTPCTTTSIPSPTPSKGLRIPCAARSTRSTDRSMTGSWRTSGSFIAGRSSLPV